MAGIEDELAQLDTQFGAEQQASPVEAELAKMDSGQLPTATPVPRKKRDPDTLKSAVGRSVDNLQANFGGTVETLGEQLGSESMAKAGGEYRDKQLKEAEKYGVPSIGSIYNVHSLGDAAQYAEDTIAGAAPGVAAIIGAGAAGARVAPGPLKVPAAVGASLFASLGINIGDVQNQIKQIDPNAKSSLGSVLAGTGMSILDVGGAGMIAKPLLKTLGKDIAEQVMISNGIKESVVKEALAHAAKAGVVEGATGAAQSAIGNIAAAKNTDTELHVSQVVENAINAAVGGSLVGSMVGGATGAIGAGKHNAVVEGGGKEVPDFNDQSAIHGVLDKVGLGGLVDNSTPQSTAGRALGALGSSSIDMLKPWARHSTEMRDFIETLRPDMTGATATKPTIFEDSKLTSGKWNTRLDEVKDEVGGSKNFNKVLDDYLNNENPVTPAAQKFKALMDDVHTYAKTEGRLKDIGKINRYLPIGAEPKIVEAKRAEFLADILPHYGNDAAKANEAIDNWLIKSKNQPDQVPNIHRLVDIDPATGDLKIQDGARFDKKDPDTMKFKFSQGQIPPENSHLEKQRAFAQVPQAIITKYAKQQTGKERYNAVADYLESAAHRVAFTKQFGPRGERANATIAKAVRQAQAAGYRPSKKEVKRAFDQLDAYNGMLNPIQDKGLKAAQSGAAALLTIKTLPLAGFSTLVETMTPAIRGDIQSAIQGVAPALSEMARGVARRMFAGVPKSEWATMASEAGISLSAATNVAAQRLGGTALSRGAAKLTTKFFLANGLTVLTHATRVYAAKVGEKVMDKNLRAIAAGVPLSSPEGIKASNMLRSMGLDVRTPEAASAILFPSGPTQIAAARDTRIKAMHRFASQAVLEPTSADTPMWMSDNRMHLVAMLHRYPSAFTNTLLPQLVRRMSPGWNGGNLAAGSAAVGSLFLVGMMMSLGYIQDELKSLMKNGEFNGKDTRTEGQKFLDVVNQSIMPVQASWIMDFFSAPRYGSSGFGSLSPALGFVEDTSKSVYNFVNKPEEGSIYQYLYKQTPAQFFRPGREAAKELDIF